MEARVFRLPNEHAKRQACQIIAALDPGFECEIRPERGTRTHPQNDHMWRLVRAIAQGENVERTKDRLLMMWAGYETKTLPNGHEYPVPSVGGSSKLTKAQMSEFIDWLQAFCVQWGIEA